MSHTFPSRKDLEKTTEPSKGQARWMCPCGGSNYSEVRGEVSCCFKGLCFGGHILFLSFSSPSWSCASVSSSSKLWDWKLMHSIDKHMLISYEWQKCYIYLKSVLLYIYIYLCCNFQCSQVSTLNPTLGFMIPIRLLERSQLAVSWGLRTLVFFLRPLLANWCNCIDKVVRALEVSSPTSKLYTLISNMSEVHA